MIIPEKTADYLYTNSEDKNDSLFFIMNNGTFSYNYEMRVNTVVTTAPVLKTN